MAEGEYNITPNGLHMMVLKKICGSHIKSIVNYTVKNKLQLDRINVNDHYYKDNCRWADYTLQRVNVRNKEEYCGYNLITNQFYNFNNCAEFCERFGFVREAVTRVLSGKLNMHHNCIFVKIETNSHDAYMKLLDKAKTLFVKYPKLAEQNKQYLESKK